MHKQIYYQKKLEIKNDARRFFSHFIRSKWNENVKTEDKALDYAYYAIRLLCCFVVKILYVGLFCYVPYNYVNHIYGDSAFPLTGSMIYLVALLTGICGSLVNSAMFDIDDDAYYMLNTMRVSPDTFFKGRMVIKLLSDFVSFFVALIFFGMAPGMAFYACIWVLVSRTVGEILNLGMFTLTGKAIYEYRALSAAVMGITILFAYAFPYARKYVVDLTKYLFDSTWIAVGTSIGAIALFFIFSYKDYPKVAKRFCNLIEKQFDDITAGHVEELELLMDTKETQRSVEGADSEKTAGKGYIYKKFYMRNAEYIRNMVFVRLFIAIVVTIATSLIAVFSDSTIKEMIWKIQCESLPIMVFSMFFLSTTPKYCKALFYHMDRMLLRNSFYGRRLNNYRHYFIRLRKAVRYDFVVSVFVCVGMGIVGYYTGHGADLERLGRVCFGIILLGVLYSVFFLTIYYLFQPYTFEMKKKNYGYYAMEILVLVISYLCVYVNVSSILFNMIVGIILIVSICAGATLVFIFSGKTFKIHK